MITVMLLLALAAFICCIADALGKCPSWVWGILLCIIALIHNLPIGK
jgi:hypothetical protein